MAANTRSAWTETRVGYTGDSLYKASCTVLADTANHNAFSNKTPRGLDVKRPWSLTLTVSGDISGSGTPALHMFCGSADDFVIANTAGMEAVATGTSIAGKIQLLNNIATILVTLPLTIQMTPNTWDDGGAVADVVTVAAIATGPKVRIPCMPYYSFGVEAGAILAAETMTFTIIQPALG